jgi:hypothetical protein
MQDRVSETGATGGAIPTSGGHSIQYLLELASTLGNIDSLEKIIVIISNIVKAISEDAASVGVPFDTSHPFYKTVMEEIGGLKDAATYLRDCFPDTSPYKTQLEQIVKTLEEVQAAPDSTNIQQLTKIVKDLMTISTHIPPGTVKNPVTGNIEPSGLGQKVFWDKLSAMFSKMKELPQAEIEKAQKIIETLEGERSVIDKAMKDIEDVVDVIATGAPLTPEIISKLLRALGSVDWDKYPQLKAKLDTILSALAQLSGPSAGGAPNNNFMSRVMGALIAQEINKWCAANPDRDFWDPGRNPRAPLLNMVASIRDAFSKLPGFNDPSSPMQRLFNPAMLDQMLNLSSGSLTFPTFLRFVYPPTPPYGSGQIIGSATPVGGVPGVGFRFVLNSSDILETYAASFTIDPNDTQNQALLDQIKKAIHETTDDERGAMDKEIARQTKIKEDLSAVIFASNTAKQLATVCAQNAFRNVSLPDAFKHAILDVFMPMQEKILEKYANELYYCNQSVRYYNRIIGIVNSFTSSDTTYSGSSEFRANFPETRPTTPPGARPYYTGSMEEAKKILEKEVESAKSDQKNIEKAIKEIDDSLKKIEKDPNLSPEQKKELSDKLQSTKTSLEAAHTHLQNLIDTIGGVHFWDRGGNTFQISFPTRDNVYGSEALRFVTDAEYDVINGAPLIPGGERIGGLKVIANQLNVDRTDYSSMSDQAQLELQNAMTKVQQEWTIVATALQLLHQMYMTVSRGIKGG